MKAITIWQPWATLLASQVKIYETRGWATKYRGPIAIHASKKPIRICLILLTDEAVKGIQDNVWPHHEAWAENLPIGAVIATAELVECHLIDHEFISKLTPLELALGDFTLGRYAWEFRDMKELLKPVQAKGGQRLWNWEGVSC